jgi:hypothetical protein
MDQQAEEEEAQRAKQAKRDESSDWSGNSNYA